MVEYYGIFPMLPKGGHFEGNFICLYLKGVLTDFNQISTADSMTKALRKNCHPTLGFNFPSVHALFLHEIATPLQKTKQNLQHSIPAVMPKLKTNL